MGIDVTREEIMAAADDVNEIKDKVVGKAKKVAGNVLNDPALEMEGQLHEQRAESAPSPRSGRRRPPGEPAKPR